jgi:hypothetical protein
MWGALSDERTGLSFTISAGHRQRSHFRIRILWDSWPYFTVSDSRFPFSSAPTTHRATQDGGVRLRLHTGFSRNRNSLHWSKIYVKYKTCDSRNWKKHIYVSTYPPPTLLHSSHCFTSASKPAAQKYFDFVSATSAPPLQPLRHQRNVCHDSRPSCEPLYTKTLPAINRKNFFMNILCIESFCPQKRTKNTALRYNTP